MLTTARPTLTDGVGPRPARMSVVSQPGSKPEQAAGVPKAGKLRIKFRGQVVVNKTIAEADTGARKGQKRKLENAGPAAQEAFARKALSSGMESIVKPVLLAARDLEAILGAPHAKLQAPKRASPTPRHSAQDAAVNARMTPAAAQRDHLAEKLCQEQPRPSAARPSAKKQRLQGPAPAQLTAAPSEPAPAAQAKRLRATPAKKESAAVKALHSASAPAQAAAQQLQRKAVQPTHSSAAGAQLQQAQPSNAVFTGTSTAEQVILAQAAQQAAPKAAQATSERYSVPGRDLPVVERARAELRAAVAQREHEKAAQQEAARTQTSAQASPQQQQQPKNASSGPQNQKSLPAQSTAGAQTVQVCSEEKARWLAKIRARRPTQEQKEAEEKQRIAEVAKREEERKQQEAEEKARREAIKRIDKLQETLRKYRATGVPEWLQKSALFEEEERDEWVGVYELAGLPWPAKYDIPGACCMPDGADAAAAQPGQAGPPLEPSHENPSRLARSESDMDIDDPALPVVPKMSLQAAIKSTPVVAQAAASGQSCGTHNGASPDIVNTSMAPPAQLYPGAAAGPQAEACLKAAAAVLQTNHAVKGCRPSPGSSESETEGVNIPAPKLEEGELAGNCRSAPQKDQQPGKDVTRDLTASYERRSRERYSSERMSREQSPSRLRHDWLERSRSRSRDAERTRGARGSSLDCHINDRESCERYTYQRDSRERPSHERDSRERYTYQRDSRDRPSHERNSRERHFSERDRGEHRYSKRNAGERHYGERDHGEHRYSERDSRERSPSRACRDRRERSRSRCRDDERPRRAPAGTSAHEDPAELRVKMEALKSSTQHDERYLEVALAALQRRLVKALMAEHLQKKQSREADRAKSRPVAASREGPERVVPERSAVVSTDKPTAAHTAAPPLPEGLPPPKLAPLPPVPVMPAAPWPAQGPGHPPSGLPACYPPAQHAPAVGTYPPQYGRPWAQQGWGTAPGVQYAPGMPQYWP